MKKTLILLIAAMLSLAGCIANMTDLKDRAATTDEPVVPAAVDEPVKTDTADTDDDVVVPKKAPVARISAFGPNGALLFKSSFTAEDPAATLPVEEKSALKLIAGDSETLEPGANLTGFAWTLNGKPLEGTRQATAELGEAGLYVITLVVTDSNGQSDSQTLKLGVAPKPVDIVTELVTGPIAGAEGEGQAGAVSFDLALDGAGVPAAILAVRFTATPPIACDAILDVVGPDEASLGAKDETGFGEPEEISAGALAPGAYAITVAPFACAAPDGVPVTITVTYLPVVEGMAAEPDGPHAH